MSQYSEVREGLISKVKNVKKISQNVGFQNISDISDKLITRMTEESFHITIVGEFNRGKSTLVNALLGADIIPTAARETTATINIISYNETPRITIVKMSGERVEVQATKESFKEYTALKDFDASEVHHVEVGYPADFLKDGIVLVDTPGVNDISEQRLEITYGYMPLSDATIILLDSRTPFKGSEKTFIEDHILKNNIPTLFFLLNKIDLLDGAQIENVRRDVEKKLLEVLKSEKVSLAPISTDLAFKGFMEEDEQKIQNSFFLPFKKRLVEFISGNERSESLIRGMNLQLIGLIRKFLESLELELSQMDRSLEELESQKKALTLSTNDFRNRFEEITKYIDKDYEALTARIEAILLDRYKDLYESLMLEIDTSRSDLTDYAEKILPLKFKQTIKCWLEQNAQSIEEFLAFTTRNSVEAFQQEFSKTIIINHINSKANISSSIGTATFQIKGKQDLKDTENIAMGVGALVVGGITAVATGGLSLAVIMPSLIGGSFLSGKFVTPYFADKILQEQKQELQNQLRTTMRSQFEYIRKTLQEHCCSYYTSLKEEMEREFESLLSGISADIQFQIEKQLRHGEDIEKKKTELFSARESLLKLEPKL